MTEHWVGGMTFNLSFLEWCNHERAKVMDVIADMDKTIASLVVDDALNDETSSLRLRLEHYLRYYDTLGEAMLAHRDVYRNGRDDKGPKQDR